MNKYESFHDGVVRYLNEVKKEIDVYFDKKVKEFEAKTASSPYVDPYPEEVYTGLSSPDIYYKDTPDFDVMLFNRKLMEYKPAYILNGRKFFDSKYTLPVSEGWEFHTGRWDNIKLSEWHNNKCKELKMSWREYFDKYLDKL